MKRIVVALERPARGMARSTRIMSQEGAHAPALTDLVTKNGRQSERISVSGRLFRCQR